MNIPSVARAGAPLCLSQHTFADGSVYGCLLGRGHGEVMCAGMDGTRWFARVEEPLDDVGACAGINASNVPKWSATPAAYPGRVTLPTAKEFIAAVFARSKPLNMEED